MREISFLTLSDQTRNSVNSLYLIYNNLQPIFYNLQPNILTAIVILNMERANFSQLPTLSDQSQNSADNLQLICNYLTIVVKIFGCKKLFANIVTK